MIDRQFFNRMFLFDQHSRYSNRFLLGIILPTSLAVILLVCLIYLVIIPAFEKSFVDSKRVMIKELTSVAWSVMALYESREQDGLISLEVAQHSAMSEIEKLRYGDTGQNYFWIMDLQPKMVMHPYSREMIGTDLSQYQDSDGRYVFLEFIKVASASKDGFLSHTWHTKYNDQKVVSKLSHVQEFAPWGWIVGTGVFLDDVQEKARGFSNRLTIAALGVVILFSFMFLYVSHQSLAIEKKRRRAESELKKSREKYKTLVETATEAIMMIVDGQCRYSNSSMWQLLDYSRQELELLDLIELFVATKDDPCENISTIKALLSGESNSGLIEISMLKKDGTPVQTRLTFFTKLFGDEDVLLMTVRDLSRQKKIKEQLGESREQFRILTGRLPIGIFRTKSAKGFHFLEANAQALRLFNLTEGDLEQAKLVDYLGNIDKTGDLVTTLKAEDVVKEKISILCGENDNQCTISLSLVLTRDSKGNPLYLDGIAEDITQQKERDREREALIVELQTSMMFLNQPLQHILSDCVACDLQTPIREAAKIMVESRRNSLLIRDKSGEHVGIITDQVLREQVVAENISLEKPVHGVMSSPIISVEESAMVFEAVLLMSERGIKHLGVKDARGRVAGVISNEELLEVQRLSSTFLINEINGATNVTEIAECHARLPRIVKALADSGVHAKIITRIITAISEAVLDKLMDFALRECGDPPVSFAFVSLGSEGRGEQTLATDQDNAVIFEDVSEEQLENVNRYFHRLSTSICTWLDQAGYEFCKGNFMAMNPKWCQPISTWEKYFSSWAADSDPQDLLEAGIFFDFKCSYGDDGFVKQIRTHIQNVLEHRPAFFHLMAENTLLFKIPLDFFGNISVESEGPHAGCFNIKHVIAMIVGFARIYAIQYSLNSTNTLQRFELLHEKGVLTTSTYEEIVESYNYLMQIRFRHQVKKINMGESPDNFVTLTELSQMEKEMLKKIFTQIGTLRKKLSSMGQREIFF